MINILPILICGIFSMVLGGIWYGPIFGKRWSEIIGGNFTNKKAREAMQKAAGPLYFLQFVLTLMQLTIFSYFVAQWDRSEIMMNTMFLWLAFIIPMIAAGSMWNNDGKKKAWDRFFIQSGYQTILFIVFGAVFMMWK
jgi:hypothetical protein